MKKYSLILIVTAAILLEVMGAAQYFLATYGTETKLLEKASRDMNESLRVGTVKGEVESALRNIYKEVEASIDNPENYYRIASRLVNNNSHIVGAGVAFRPDFYKSQGKAGLYAPYVYDLQADVKLKKKKTSTPTATPTLLPFDYTDREWFKKPLADGKSMWTEPYLDKGGTHIIMCTYVMAVRDSTGNTAGVFFADVPMEDVSMLSMEIHQGIVNSRTVLFIIQVISLIVICFIVWLAIRAFRRYKLRFVDPEKTQLIEQLEKMRESNNRLTKRNQELAEKVAEMRNRADAISYTTDTNW